MYSIAFHYNIILNKSDTYAVYYRVSMSRFDVEPEVQKHNYCVVCCVLCVVCCVLCAVCGVLCAVCGVRCAVCGVRCAVCCVLCAVCCVICDL